MQRVRSWTVQNEMRDVLGRVSTGAASNDSRFCQSYRDKNLKEGCVRCSEDERGHSEHDEGAQVPRWKSREPVCQNTLMRQYASSPRKDKNGYEERDYKGLRRAQVALPVWPARKTCRSPGETSVRGPIVA